MGTSAGIVAVGAYRPARVVTNDEACALVDTTDEWVRSRSGIVTRLFADENETVASMAAVAAEVALERAGVDAKDVDLVIVATSTHPYIVPSAGAMVVGMLPGCNAASFDLNAACAGFTQALTLADALVRSKTARNVLAIGSDKFTDWIDFTDRGTAFIFGDGAGAALVSQTPVQGIFPPAWGTNGAGTETITMSQNLIDYKHNGGEVYPSLRMDGPQVFRWAVGDMPAVAKEALAKAGISADDLAAFVPHQANMRIIDGLVRAIGIPERVIVSRDVEHIGNTSAGSIPIALDALRESGEAAPGGLALLLGFGAGLAYAGMVIRLPGQ